METFCNLIICAVIFAVILLFAVAAVRYLLDKFSITGISNKTIFITGCDSGFGKLLALKLTNEGCTIFAGCLTEDGAKNLISESSQLAGNLSTVIVDVRSDESVRNAVEFTKKQLQHENDLWALVSNAGIMGTCMPDEFLQVEDYQKVLDVNALGMIRVCQAFKPLIKKSRGRIVNVTSMAARIPGSGMCPYFFSKSAAEAYCDVLRQELMPFNVTVCIVAPAGYKTRMVAVEPVLRDMDDHWVKADAQTREEYGTEFFEKYKKSVALGFTVFCSDNRNEVVDTCYHAVTARFPRKRYNVGLMAHLAFVPISLLPTGLQDIIHGYMITKLVTKVPTPKACKS